MRRRLPIKCKARVFKYLRGSRDGVVWRVDAVGVRRRPPLKCKHRVLKYLREMRDGEWVLCVRGRPPIKYKDRVFEYLWEMSDGDIWKSDTVFVRRFQL